MTSRVRFLSDLSIEAAILFEIETEIFQEGIGLFDPRASMYWNYRFDV